MISVTTKLEKGKIKITDNATGCTGVANTRTSALCYLLNELWREEETVHLTFETRPISLTLYDDKQLEVDAQVLGQLGVHGFIRNVEAYFYPDALEYVVTHIPTGKRIWSRTFDQADALALVRRLHHLDWDLHKGEIKQHTKSKTLEISADYWRNNQ